LLNINDKPVLQPISKNSHHGLSLTSVRFFENVFGSVVADAFQIIFRVKMHANNIFLFLKNQGK
jgi:hypothetical protein